jgi:hypothetical protein
MVSGVPGGRSTHGVCFGVLGWLVDEGHAGDVDLSGLAAALVVRYDDDEEGSPWSLVAHVDQRADARQHDELAAILLGERGGDEILRLPWVRKPRNVIDVRSSPIVLDHEPSGYRLLVGEAITVSADEPYATDEPVRCGIPGYDQPGVELVAQSFSVDDPPFAWDIVGNCAFASRFAYRG